MAFFAYHVFWILLLLPISAQAGPSVGEQLEVQGYKPASCQASPPSTYKVGDTSVPLTIVNDLPVKLQPAYLDLAGIVKLLPKREASSSWQDSTYKGTIWLWLDDTNKTCLGMSLIQDVKYQPSTIRISDLSLHQSATVEPPPDSSEPTSQEDAKVEGNSIQAKERAALAAFYGVTDGGGWSKNSGWLTEENHCDWYGVDCENGRVTGINLRYNRVTGEIPALVGEFTRLKTLNLEGNKLQGSIPAELTNLRELRTLDLSANKLSGSLPVTFSRLTKLRKLDLNGSSISGRLAAVGSMSLYYLDVRGNDFTEQLSALGKQTGMRYFYISDNNFMGEIPEWLEDWKYLYYFDISNNRLSGSFPRGVAERLAKVRSAKIGGNDFRCPIPFILRDTLANSGEFCIGFEVENTYSGELEAYYDYKSKTDFGHIAFKSRFKDGMRDGLHQRWHPDGTLMHEAEYKEGKKNGAWKSWDAEGKQWEDKNYLDGKLHGTYLTFNKGAVSKEYCYKKGKRIYSKPCAPGFDHEPESLREKERKVLVAFYEATGGANWKEQDGWLTDRNHCDWHGVTCSKGRVTKIKLDNNNLSGDIASEQAKFLLGLHDSDWTNVSLRGNKFTCPLPATLIHVFASEGEFCRSGRLDRRGTLDLTTYYETGERLYEGTYSSSDATGRHRKWDRNGQIRYDIYFDRGKHGHWRYWHENGRLKEEKLYRHGLNGGVYRAWDGEGKLITSSLTIPETNYVLRKRRSTNGSLTTLCFRELDTVDISECENRLRNQPAASSVCDWGDCKSGVGKQRIDEHWVVRDFQKSSKSYTAIAWGRRVCEQNPGLARNDGYFLRVCSSFGTSDDIEFFYFKNPNVSSPRLRVSAGGKLTVGVTYDSGKTWEWGTDIEKYDAWLRSMKDDWAALVESDVHGIRLDELPKRIRDYSLPMLKIFEHVGSQEAVAVAGRSDNTNVKSLSADSSSGKVRESEKSSVNELNSHNEKESGQTSGARLALIVSQLNGEKRTYNPMYRLEKVRMDFDTDQLLYEFSLSEESLDLSEDVLRSAAKTAYCSSDKLRLFREEKISSRWEYSFEGNLVYVVVVDPVSCSAS